MAMLISLGITIPSEKPTLVHGDPRQSTMAPMDQCLKEALKKFKSVNLLLVLLPSKGGSYASIFFQSNSFVQCSGMNTPSLRCRLESLQRSKALGKCGLGSHHTVLCQHAGWHRLISQGTIPICGKSGNEDQSQMWRC